MKKTLFAALLVCVFGIGTSFAQPQSPQGHQSTHGHQPQHRQQSVDQQQSIHRHHPANRHGQPLTADKSCRCEGDCAETCCGEAGCTMMEGKNMKGCAMAGGCMVAGGCMKMAGTADARQIYEWRVYTLSPKGDAAGLDAFLRDVLVPAYGRYGVKVGAFAPAQDYPEFPAGARYLFVAWPDLATYQRVSRAVREDDVLAAAGAGYFDASAPNPAYTALETYLCEAFDAIPQMRPIPARRGLLEFRVYRSPNMEANERKIKMFENGEMDIFDDTGVNIVCFGRTLAGSRMPSLVYLTWYDSIDTRGKAWERFGADPRWRQMSSMPEYAHTATDNLVRLLTPLPWSQY